MCFEVVLFHFWKTPVFFCLIPFSLLEGLAVPIFMFLSFYLTEKTIIGKNAEKKRNRILRILYPQIGWTFIYWLIYVSIQTKFDLHVTFVDLAFQLFTGHSPVLNPSMWYQIVLFVLTITFFLIFKYFDEKRGVIFIFVMLLISLFMQYSKINFHLFGHLRYEIEYPLGRIFEMFPYAFLGFTCAYYKIFTRLEERNYLSIIILLLGTLFLLNFRIIPSALGFGYSHNNNLVLAFFIVGLFFLLPFEKLPVSLKNTIKFISKYTLGIYCSHRLIAFFVGLVGFVNVNSFSSCVIVYIT